MHALRNRHFFLLDLLLLPIVAVLAFALRLDAVSLQRYSTAILLFTVIAVPVKLLVFVWTGLYSRFWRYASTNELILIVFATGVSAAVVAALLVALLLSPLGPESGYPRSIPFIDGLLTLFVVGGLRFGSRLAWQRRRRGERREGQHTSEKWVLIMGAGDAGAMIVKEMWANPQLGLAPLGFLDDDETKHGVRIHGVPVLGGRERIPEIARKVRVNEVIIAMPTAPGSAIRAVLDICAQIGVPARTIPGIYDILSGRVGVDQIREVEIEDLLRRAPVEVDSVAVERMVHGSRVLVTGAGGSIGSELCRQIARCQPQELVLLGHGENSIFSIANELRHRWPGLPIQQVIADVRDLERLRQVFAACDPQVVLHAAAHKHVPLMEMNLCDAVTNNVLGTRNLLHVSEESGVERFVLISTDKVVRPTSVMGVTKRVAELLLQQSARRSGHHYVAVRFGNVLGSRGSVVPFFQEQIARGGPVTVTDPEVRRYFMTIPEAVQLVLQAAALGQGGEVFILDMGEPVKIIDLAVDLIRLSGLRPRVRWPGQDQPADGRGRDWDIEVVFTGLRPGEKLFEELFVQGEEYAPTRHQKIFVARNGHNGSVSSARLDWAVDELIDLARHGEGEAVRSTLREIVPAYTPNGDGAKPHEPAVSAALHLQDRERIPEPMPSPSFH